MENKSIFWIFVVLFLIVLFFSSMPKKAVSSSGFSINGNLTVNGTLIALLHCSNVTGSNMDLCNITSANGTGTATTTLPIANITNGTFSSGNYIFQDNVTINGYLFGGSPLKINSSINLTSSGIYFSDGTFQDSASTDGSPTTTLPLSNITGMNTTQCSGTDKVINVTFLDGSIYATCGSDQTGGGTPTTTLNETWRIELDFLMGSASVFDPFLGTAISSGTIAAASGDMLHPGIIGLRDSTTANATANGGYMIRTDAAAFLLAGNEKATFVFRQNTARGNVSSAFIYRMGFLDTATFTIPTDGCYIEVNASYGLPVYNLTGKCIANNVQTITTTAITITNLQWYKGIITTDATASNVLFQLYAFDGNLLWNGTINSNIPTAAGRETGFGVIATENSTDAAADIVQMDYMLLQIFNRSTVIRQAYTSNAQLKFSQEFLTASASVFDPFLGTAISSGVIDAFNSTSDHLGIIELNDSTTANGGYRMTTDATSFLLAGNETATFVFKPYTNRENVTMRFGWFDTTTFAEPTDGCYLFFNTTRLIYNATLNGICRSNNAMTITSTSINLTYLNWYTGKIQTDATASVVNFSLYNGGGVLVWNNTINSNIPTAAGRETGFGVIATEGSTDATKRLVLMDYMDLTVGRSFNR